LLKNVRRLTSSTYRNKVGQGVEKLDKQKYTNDKSGVKIIEIIFTPILNQLRFVKNAILQSAINEHE